jgi:hypothetical protein
MSRAALLLALACIAASGAEPSTVDPRFPFRTDWANAQLAWYQLKPGEFPPHHSDHRVGGELIAADYIHRSGTFRMDHSGELVDFTMPPFGAVYYLNFEADLRDVPLGTYYLFFLHQDDKGAFTRVSNMEDEYTMVANHGFSFRLDEVRAAEKKLMATKRKVAEGTEVGKAELLYDDATRVWKGDQRIAVGELKAGDELLFSASGNLPASPRRCTEIWVGAATQAAATAAQRSRRFAFLKERGLPAIIDAVDGRTLTVTFIANERSSLMELFKAEGIDAAKWAAEHRTIEAVVANQELRTYNPPVDKQGCRVLEARTIPADCYGSSGEQWVIEPNLLLEGFRKGRIIRLFVKPSWPVKDMAFGEGLYDHVVEGDDPDAHAFPYRTDRANAALPWYQLQAGRFPPASSQHEVDGELVAADAAHRRGRFRSDDGGAQVDFTMTPSAAVLHLGAEGELGEVPLGTRLRFCLYQDGSGAFTRAALISDELSRFAASKLSWRIDKVEAAAGRLEVSRMTQEVVNYHGDKVRPPPLGHAQLSIDGQTALWKGDARIAITELTVGDEILFDHSGRTATSSGRCTGVWVGHDTIAQLIDRQRAKHVAATRARGMPAWIDSIEGKRLTLCFFAGVREDFRALLDGDPHGKQLSVQLLDDELHAHGAPVVKMWFRDHLPEGATAGTLGCSGQRWVIEPEQLPEGYRVGSIIRVAKLEWPFTGSDDEVAPVVPGAAAK